MSGPRSPELPRLAAALEAEEARVRQLEQARVEAQARADALRARIETLEKAPVTAFVEAPRKGAPQSAREKVRLFRSLFRGREDVYPTRFVSARTGKTGYAPACPNKWEPGLCSLKSGGKCGDCTNQAFRAVDDRAVLDHLRGKHVMGIYPMLPDETCWFLAVDFDKQAWKDDAHAFAIVARRLGLAVLIERSRSGNGAHVWFFFSEPIPAGSARKMGCHILTEAMAARHELSMSSYDRLFPSQDTMPRGGFGNLIALPLQHGPRKQGNSVFLDEDLRPYPEHEQWSVLASVERITPAIVERIVSTAARDGTVLGVRGTDSDNDQDQGEPWSRPPSGTPRDRRIAGPLPAVVSAVLAQRLFVAKAGLSPLLLNQIKRLAAFQNPEFYKRQAMRFSTARIPRVIECAEELPNHIALPRGSLGDLRALLENHGIAFEIADERTIGVALKLQFRGKLTAIQESAARALLAHDTGVLVAPPGVGKTVIGTYLMAERACNTLILVHRRPLLDQWLAQIALFLGVERKEIGQIGGSTRAPTGRLDVAMVQSLVRRESVLDAVAGYGQVIVDECHHVPAIQFERVLREVKARYVVGLTATPERRDGHHPIAEMQIGPTRFKVSTTARESVERVG